MAKKEKPIGVSELINRIKLDLLSEEGSGAPLFLIGNIELEISFTVDRAINGGIDLQVVSSGVEKTTTEVQKIKLTLEPLEPIERRRLKLTQEHLETAAKVTMRSEE
jgi:hypothetical protein